MRALRLTRAAVCAVLLLSQQVLAGTIALKMDTTSWSRDGVLGANISIVNQGTDPAFNIALSVRSAELRQNALLLSRIDPDEAKTVSIELDGLPDEDGVHPMIIEGSYEDARGHPYALVETILAATVLPQTTNHLAIESSQYNPVPGNQHLVLVNHSMTDIEAVIRLQLPDSLRAKPAAQTMTVPGRKRLVISTAVEDLNGAPGSSYEVAFTVEFEQEGLHRALLDLGTLVLPPSDDYSPRHMQMALPLFITFLLVVICLVRTWRSSFDPDQQYKWEKGLLIAAGLCWVIYFFGVFPLELLLKDTTVVGGDTAAHPYLASHLSSQLFGEGRIVSWADGWWCGFPMFQFYFALPYIFIAILDVLLPFNVAFKFITVLGLFTLPFCTWQSARWMRLPYPVPFVAALLMLPFLFVRAHTMWGVNVYSTLAGMFANSISFSFFVLALGAVFRDADEGKVRLSSIFLLTAVLFSHFFTSIVIGAVLILLPLLFVYARRPVGPVLRVLFIEGLIAGLLMSWWLLPLIFKMDFTIDYGGNWGLARIWSDTIIGNMEYLIVLGLFTICGVCFAVAKRRPAECLLLWLSVVSTILLVLGYRLHPVFNDIRLWPFMVFGLTMMTAIGLGMFLTQLDRIRPLALSMLTLGAFIAVIVPPRAVPGQAQPNEASTWAIWNYSGGEARPDWAIFKQMLEKLDGTPGRLAADMHDLSDRRLGSSRFMEVVPHLVDKRIVEGGILSSSPGALYAYMLQGEISHSSAGLPNEVSPLGFDMDAATRHFRLLNVKHMIARSPRTQRALMASPDWSLLMEGRGLMLFELTTHNADDVVIPSVHPVHVTSDDWKGISIDWFRHSDFYDAPLIIDAHHAPDGLMRMTAEECAQQLESGRSAWPAGREDHAAAVSKIVIEDGIIRFKTTGIGMPHLVKVNYYPNWKAVRGADTIYRATPNFMMVIPTAHEVELAYGSTAVDNIGRVLTCVGLLVCVVSGWRARRHCKGGQSSKPPS